jgi:hypothetical protein
MVANKAGAVDQQRGDKHVAKALTPEQVLKANKTGLRPIDPAETTGAARFLAEGYGENNADTKKSLDRLLKDPNFTFKMVLNHKGEPAGVASGAYLNGDKPALKTFQIDYNSKLELSKPSERAALAVGKAILNQQVDEAKKNGAQFMMVEVEPGAMTKRYTDLGFREIAFGKPYHMLVKPLTAKSQKQLSTQDGMNELWKAHVDAWYAFNNPDEKIPAKMKGDLRMWTQKLPGGSWS